MRAFHQSIRWLLQLWHSALLVAVLVSFGFTAYWLLKDNLYKRVDAELQSRMTVVMAGIGPEPSETGRFLKSGFRLTADQEALFGRDQSGTPYYVVWLPPEDEQRTSPDAPSDVPRPEVENIPQGGSVHVRGDLRELVAVSDRRRGSQMAPASRTPYAVAVVGISTAATRAELARFGLSLTATGSCVFVIGIAVGWLVSGRAISPIKTISTTAKSIAEGNLSERIDLGNTRSELGELAAVLNGTFDRLHSTFERQAQFTADASHELRTPTFVILSQAQSALRRERSREENRKGFEICERAARQLQDLIEALLILTRSDGGESNQEREPCALGTIATEAVEVLRSLATSREITLHVEAEPTSVEGDALQLRQVVTNLVGNAIEHNRPGGDVRVTVAKENQNAVLTVSDNGPGIHPDDLPRIFDRFYRADKSRSSTDGHPGLGLAICKVIVAAHGGSIEVSSRVDEGSAFTVRLPVLAANA